MLNKQRREKPLMPEGDQGRPPGREAALRRRRGSLHRRSRLHAAFRLPVAVAENARRSAAGRSGRHIDQSCVGCGNCGEVADAAVLCPSFYRADVVHNPGWLREATWSAWRHKPHHRLAAGPPRRRGGSNSGDIMTGSWKRDDSTALAKPDAALDEIIKLAIMAVGGQGGGVLTNWIEAMRRSQRLFRAGDQRRGCRPAHRRHDLLRRDGARPGTVASRSSRWMPAAGDVDILIAAEMMEAGRAIMRGFVTPDRTTLIASTHRALAVSEKTVPGDGIAVPRR
jgi:hypothetical protein